MEWSALADRIIQTATATFGEMVVYHPQLKAPLEVRAIFDAAYQEVDPQIGVSIGSTYPVIDLRLADLPCSPSPGDRVCIRGEDYRVVSHQPDGQGAARLALHKL